MKRFEAYILFVVVVYVLSACVKTQNIDWSGPSPIFYQAAVSPVTKSDNSSLYPETLKFVSAAFHNNSGNDNREPSNSYISPSEIAFKDGEWKAETVHYWPGTGSLTFLSYSPSVTPADVVIDRDGIRANDWDVSSQEAQGVDFMVAEIRTGETANSSAGIGSNATMYNGVPTIFHHKLSKVSVSVRGNSNSQTTSEIVIKAVRLTGAYAVGDYVGGAPGIKTWTNLINNWTDTWTTKGMPKNFVFYSDSVGHNVVDKAEYDLLGEALMMIPQTLGETSKIEIDFTENGGSTVTVPLEIPEEYRQWKIGHSTNYAISFNVGNIDFDVQTGNWTGTGSSITVGDKYNPGI